MFVHNAKTNFFRAMQFETEINEVSKPKDGENKKNDIREELNYPPATT